MPETTIHRWHRDLDPSRDVTPPAVPAEVGDRVTCNGYPGTVTEVCTGQLSGMFLVRVPGGITCVGRSEFEITPTRKESARSTSLGLRRSAKIPSDR